MASRDEILAAIRSHQPAGKELPSLASDWITYPDRQAQFASVLEAIGGHCLRVRNAKEANQRLGEISAYREAKSIVSLVPGVGRSNVDLSAISDPHQLATVEFAILPGEFGVAENAAVWVTDRGISHRAVFFIVQHLALVLWSREIVDNMHQ